MDGWTMSWTEVAGFATGALCVWLVVRQNVWTFPVGIANNVNYGEAAIRSSIARLDELGIPHTGAGAVRLRRMLKYGRTRQQSACVQFPVGSAGILPPCSGGHCEEDGAFRGKAF
jgi:hypothetical protein